MRIHLAVAEDQVEVEGFYVSIALGRVRMARDKICERSFAGGDNGFNRIESVKPS